VERVTGVLSTQSVSLVDMTNIVTTPPGSRSLKCVATTAKGLDLSIREADEIRTSYEQWEQQNNYFRSAEWYAT
jgi:hypothetical protein